MRIVFKILLFPVALLCQVLAVCVSALGSILTIGLRLLAGLAGIGFFAALIDGIMKRSMDVNWLVSGAIIATVLTAVSMFVESLPDTLSRFSGWVWSL